MSSLSGRLDILETNRYAYNNNVLVEDVNALSFSIASLRSEVASLRLTVDRIEGVLQTLSRGMISNDGIAKRIIDVATKSEKSRMTKIIWGMIA